MKLAGALFALVSVIVLAACDDPPPPTTSGRGVTRGPSDLPPIAPSAASPASGTTARRTGRDPRVSTPPPLPSLAGREAQPLGDAPEPHVVPVEDRLREALQRAFGTPTQCIAEQTRTRLTDRLTIQVQVSVTSSGRVTRASVSSSQLGAEDLECMRRHAETLRLATEVPGAPRSVTASVEYEVTPAGAVETRRELGDVPPVPGRVGPDSTLPAAGTVTDRPAGSVAPSFTLPARAD